MVIDGLWCVIYEYDDDDDAQYAFRHPPLIYSLTIELHWVVVRQGVDLSWPFSISGRNVQWTSMNSWKLQSPIVTGSRELQAVQREARDLRRFVDLLQTHWRSPQFPLHSAAGWSNRVAGWPWKWWGKGTATDMDDGYDILWYDIIISCHIISYDAIWCIMM